MYRKRKNQNYRDRYESYKKPRYEDQKYEMICRVKSQTGVRGHLVLFHSDVDIPFTILHNAVDRINGIIRVRNLDQFNSKDGTYRFQLSINNEVFAEGNYRTEAIAKRSLAEVAVTDLRKTCFTIFRKMQPRDSPKINLSASTSNTNPSQANSNAPQANSNVPQANSNVPQANSSAPQANSNPPQANSGFMGGIGAKMMMQMGWAGKGLGAQEQGRTDIVQPYIQIQRQGLGTKNIVREVRAVLENYAASKDINSIAFSPEFDKDERAVIHDIARKLNLVSKSYGQNEDRMLVVRSKIKPWDLVYSLLEAGRETEQLKLILPTDFDN